MISTGVMYLLIVIYAVILLAAMWERNYWRCLYFLGAIIISIAVLGFQKGPPQ